MSYLHCLPRAGLLLSYSQNSADCSDKSTQSEGDTDRQLQKHLLCLLGWTAFPWRSLWQCSRMYLWSWWLVQRGAKQCNQSWHLGACCQGFRKLVLLWDRPALTGQGEKPMWLLKQEWKNMDLEYALLYPAKPSVYCGGQTHLSFSRRYGVSWIKKADCSGTVEEIASEGWLIGVLYHMDPVRKILATIKADTRGDESNIAWYCDYLYSNVLKVSSGELSPFFIWPGWSLWLLQGLFLFCFVLCNKTSVIEDFFKN